MPINVVYLIGAGGHGKVVLDAILLANPQGYDVRVRDDASALQDQTLLGYSIKLPAIAAEMEGQHFHLAIGNYEARKRFFVILRNMGSVPISILHPASNVSPFASIGAGSFLAAQSVVAPAASIGESVIVNHGAVVDHDCIVGAFSHIAPNATLGGCVVLGSGVLIGAGATVLPGVSIGNGAVIGAGAVVTTNVGAGEVWVGIPARNSARN